MVKKIKKLDRATVQSHVRTSIGSSINTRPKNKHKKRSFKVYRGQGRAR
tara:strand:- start:1126 stop:1272 length:147 start_codon:yes stop_codon:yes gene_type:complete